MAGTIPFTIGAEVSCSDGNCGRLARVVIDPVARRVTHLIVEPHDRPHASRLVPVGLTDPTAGDIRLRCTVAEFDSLDPVQEARFIDGAVDDPAYGPKQAIFWPYYSLRGRQGDVVRDDAIPPYEVEVNRGEHVHATDGTIGRVEGLAVEPGTGRVSHVLLQEGHLWGRRQVAIPIGAVSRADDGIRLSLTRQQVHDLPLVDVDHPADS
jgi:sporulation protein YlmC with PRC-barrel domain